MLRLRLASFQFSQFSTSNFSLSLPAQTCCFLRKRFQLCPTRRGTLLISLTFFFDLKLRPGATRCVYVYVLLILCSNYSQNVLMLFSNEKKNLGAVFLFRFSKICCSYAGHALYLSSISSSTLVPRVLLPSPNHHNEPATTTRGYRMT